MALTWIIIAVAAVVGGKHLLPAQGAGGDVGQDERLLLAAVLAAEEACGAGAGVDNARLVLVARPHVPHVLDSDVHVGGEP